MLRLHSVVIKQMVDEDADISYLEQEGFESRMLEYRNGYFSHMGIIAEATYSAGATEAAYAPLQTVTSGGLWGIETDSSNGYVAEIEQEELAQLGASLIAIGFSKELVAEALATPERKIF
jgi:hypothetical protein